MSPKREPKDELEKLDGKKLVLRDQVIEWPSTLPLLEREIERVKTLYEKFFSGVEKLPPLRAKEKIRERLRKLVEMPIQRTEIKFRLQTIVSKFSAYERMWDRVTAQIEEGKYRPVRLRHLPQAEQAAPGAEQFAQEQEEEKDRTEVAKKRIPPSVPGEKVTPPPPPPHAHDELGIPEKKMRALFDTYIQAKKIRNESVKKITYESFSASVKKQIPVIKKKHKCKSVDFKVVTKEQKVTLKAVPQK